jgi:hypothetical protein
MKINTIIIGIIIGIFILGYSIGSNSIPFDDTVKSYYSKLTAPNYYEQNSDKILPILYQTNLQSLIHIDNENDITKTRNQIIEYVDTENLRNATVQISDGRLRFMDTKQQTPLTLHHVKKCLTECIRPPEKVDEIMTYIKQSREYKTVSNIKRSYTN